jgi:RNA polymerase sigma factor (sigma-70 family)
MQRSLQAFLRTLTDAGPSVSDAELLRRFLADEDHAFAALVRRHGRLVWAVCLHLTRSDADAEDAFQATFLVLLKNARKVRDAGKLSAWLHGVANKVCANARKAAQRRTAHERATAVHEGNGAAVPESAWDRALAAVHEETAKLPDALRVPFVLCCLEGFGPTEAAEQLGWKLGTLTGRLTRAKDAVLARLEARGLPIGVAAVGLALPSAAAVARASALSRVEFADPGSVLQLTQGVIGMRGTSIKMLAAALLLTCGLGLSVGTRWVANADAQQPPSPTAKPRADPEAEVKRESANPTGILVLDNCDDQYQGKEEYNDNLTLLDPTGKQSFRVSGFNNGESIGSSRMVAADPARKCIWVTENVAHRIRRFDLAGKETLTIPGVHASAIAIDPQTGNVWALAGEGQIGTGRTVVYDDKGKEVASYDISGWDIAYDRKARAFWIAERKLTKITAAKGEVICSADVSTWCASSVDVDARTGAAWVAVREHPDVAGSSNRLLEFDADGKELLAIDLGQKRPFRVSVDPKNGSVWVAHFMKSVERFSADGKSQAEHAVEALAVQVDPAGGDAWVVTPTEVRRITSKGYIINRINHASNTSQAWIASLE